LFVNNVVRLHGLPATLISDRGPQFNNNFWAHTWDVQRFSSPNRSTDGAYESHVGGDA